MHDENFLREEQAIYDLIMTLPQEESGRISLVDNIATALKGGFDALPYVYPAACRSDQTWVHEHVAFICDYRGDLYKITVAQADVCTLHHNPDMTCYWARFGNHWKLVEAAWHALIVHQTERTARIMTETMEAKAEAARKKQENEKVLNAVIERQEYPTTGGVQRTTPPAVCPTYMSPTAASISGYRGDKELDERTSGCSFCRYTGWHLPMHGDEEERCPYCNP